MQHQIRMWSIATTLLAMVVMPIGTAAQSSSSPVVHHTYTLIDMGTFGGPQTYPNIVQGVQSLSQTGVLSGCSETAMSNPKYPTAIPFCFRRPSPTRTLSMLFSTAMTL
ncbi:MAG TPA: hypothetical protein VKB58_00940 [Terriglobales bacterium]|jgi:hypothetical protein|nr:hypothetical protein [Terriglobales bacterium]